MKQSFWFLPATAVTIGIFFLSTFLAIPIQVEGVSGLDKWEHAFAYMTLVVSFHIAFHKVDQLSWKMSAAILIISCTYGLVLEFVQYHFFSYRFFEWKDAMANVLGALIGFLGFHAIRRLK